MSKELKWEGEMIFNLAELLSEAGIDALSISAGGMAAGVVVRSRTSISTQRPPTCAWAQG